MKLNRLHFSNQGEHYYLMLQKIILLLVFCFPLMKTSINTFFITTFGVLVLFDIIRFQQKINLKFLFFGIPFFILVISNALHGNFQGGYFQHSIAFLAIPFFFLQSRLSFNSKLFRQIMSVFTTSCVFLLLYYFGAFLQTHSFQDLFKQDYNVLIFRTFVYNIKPLNVHPTYLSIWLCFILYDQIIGVWKKKKFQWKDILNYVLIVFLGFSIFMLSSKIALICLGISLVVLILYFRKWIFLGVLILGTVGMIWQYQDADFMKRYQELYGEYISGELGKKSSSSSTRYVVFQCSTELVDEHLLWGIGENEIYPSLDPCYRQNSNFPFYKNDRFLTHNYYYYMILNGGIFALLVFFLYFGKLFQFSWKEKSLLLFLFLLNIALVNLTEDFLYRHHGVVFFNLFLMLLYRHLNASFLGDFLGTENKEK